MKDQENMQKHAAGFVCEVPSLVLVLLFSTLCPPSFAIILMGDRQRERERESLILYLKCLPDVLWQSVFCGSSSRCRGLVWCV